MKKILIPTDFSECAEYAVEVAAQIAKKNDARLYILHVLDIPEYDRNDSISSEVDVAEGIFFMKLAQKKFEELFNKPFLEGVNAVEVLQFEGVYGTIAKQAKEHEIDLIVMGSHGASGASEVFIGSNTQRVVRLADCPVLTVKKRHENFNLDSVVFASNFFGEAKENFEKLFKFIKLYDAHVHLVKVVTPDHFESTPVTEKLMEDFISEWSLTNYTKHVFNERTIHAGIHEASERIGADMIAMETHGRKGISRFFFGSQTESVVNHSDVPVLSVRIKEYKKEFSPFSDLVTD